MVALREALGKILETDHADLLRDGVALLYRELMEAEVADRVGAGRYERSDERVAFRNEYRSRQLNTRVGTFDLATPRLRSGSYFPSFLEPGKRSEQALSSVVAEAYVNGVSTRKVERLVEQLGVDSMSKSTVSRICQQFAERVAAFQQRPLEGAYPTCGWTPGWNASVSATPGWRARKHCWSPMACTRLADARVISIGVGEVESEVEWRSFLRALVARGLSGVQLVISDAHPGLKNAISQVLGAQWQRCCVHFVRDMLGHVPKTNQPLVPGALKQSSRHPTGPRPAKPWPASSPSSAGSRRKSRGCWETPRRSCSRTGGSRASTGRRSAP